MRENFISIPVNSSFSFSECLWFLDRNFDDCLHLITQNGIRKAVQTNGKPLLFELSQKENNLVIEILSENYTSDDKIILRDFVSEWLDLDRDIKPFYQLLRTDDRLAYMEQEFEGLRLVGIPDLFEALCWSIIGQQINLTFAYKLKRRLVEKYGSHIEYNNQVYYLFPSPEFLAQADPSELGEMQFSSKKAEYIIDLAKLFTTNQLSKDILKSLPDIVSRHKALTSIRGIGVWTANYALMKSLKELTCIPHGDTGLMHALYMHEIIEHKKDTLPVENFFKKFAGWESYLVFYLWRSLSKK